jgi:hypothetical protein
VQKKSLLFFYVCGVKSLLIIQVLCFFSLLMFIGSLLYSNKMIKLLSTAIKHVCYNRDDIVEKSILYVIDREKENSEINC